MKSILSASLALLAWITPMTNGDWILSPSAGGSMAIRDLHGYSNGGGDPTPRLSAGEGGNYNMGWISFYDSRATLAALLTAHPDATATLYVAYAPGSKARNTYYLETLRCGNEGGLVPDQGLSSGYSYNNPASGSEGSSGPVAFRQCAPDGATAGQYGALGNGIYTQQDPANGGGIPYITPSSFATPYGTIPGRAVAVGPNPNSRFGPNKPVRYDVGANSYGNPIGKYVGYLSQNTYLWAIEDILGIWGVRGGRLLQSFTNVRNAGQILNGQNADGSGTASLLGPNNIIDGPDPKGVGLPAGSLGWLEIPLSPALLYAMAFDPQMKALVFANNLPGVSFFDIETFMNSGGYEPYLVLTPEPSSLCLLALSGLFLSSQLLFRRRP